MKIVKNLLYKQKLTVLNWQIKMHLLFHSVLFLSFGLWVELSVGTAVCRSGEFRCQNSQHCIDEKYVCDQENDCTDGSDELNCETHTCNSDQFRCHNGQCIALRWECDEDLDCKDHSDETGCENHSCDVSNSFNCTATSNECYPLSWKCDRAEDCDGGEDEMNCEDHECEEGYFKCKVDGECISADWKCDGRSDCEDASDEADCPKQCKANEFKCSDLHECIQSEWRCDGNADCSDGSDEKNCTNIVDRNCPDTLFACHAGLPRCIDKAWHCDGDSDCEDHSDEAFCADSISNCNGTDFHCNNRRQCVPHGRVCDGADDCEDGSDEENCEDDSKTCDGNTHYLCLNSRKCIPAESVCDNLSDCPHGDDESKCGVNLCETSNCTHSCTNTPGSFVCTCRRGYQLAEDKKTCNDIDECAEDSPCDQRCINTKGSYKCECNEGYLRDPRTNACEAIDETNPEFIFSHQHSIRTMKLTPYTVGSILPVNDGAVTSLALDVEQNMLYYLDNKADTITRFSLSDKLAEGIVGRDDLKLPTGLATSGELVYWVDAILNSLSVVDPHSGLIKVLVEKNSQWTPMSITLAAKHRYIFIGVHYQSQSIRKPHGAIERYDMDGQNMKAITTAVKAPASIVYDAISDHIYWVDNRNHVIQSCGTDGQHFTTLLESLQATMMPLSITVFQDILYWSSGRNIYSMQKTVRLGHKPQLTSVSREAADITAIVINYQHATASSDTGAKDFCADAHCQMMCLPSRTSNNYTCVCPNGYKTNTQDNSCTKVGSNWVTKTEMKRYNPIETTTTSEVLTTTTHNVVHTTTSTTVSSTTQAAIMKTTKSKSSSNTMLIVVGIIAIVVLLLLAACFAYRRRNQMPKSVNFDNPVYRKTTVRFGQLNESDAQSTTSQEINGSWEAGLVQNEHPTAHNSNHHATRNDTSTTYDYKPISDHDDDDISINYNDKANLVKD